MKRLQRQHQQRAQLADLAPLVDVALLLVVFLLLTSQAVETEHLPVNVPQARTGEAGKQQELRISILATGRVLLGDEEVSPADLQKLAGQIGSRAVLQVDEACQHKHYVAVVDALRAAGCEDIVEITEAAGDGQAVEEW